jgi:hypothetical protein
MKQLIGLSKLNVLLGREFFELVGYLSLFGGCCFAYLVGIIWVEWLRDGVWLQNVGF